MSVTVRRAVEADARLDPASFRRHLAHPACIVLLADHGGCEDPVAYTMLIAGEPTDPHVAKAIRFRLMTATLQAARETGAAGIWLGVGEENDRANAFYARHGFEQVGTKRSVGRHDGGNQDAVASPVEVDSVVREGRRTQRCEQEVRTHDVAAAPSHTSIAARR